MSGRPVKSVAWMVVILSALTGGARGQVAAPPGPTAGAAHARVAAAVGRLAVADGAGEELGAGTGFWISATEVVTNWHVIMHGQNASLEMPDGARHRMTRVMGADERADVAVLRAEPAFGGRALTLTLESARPATEVRVVGCKGLSPDPALEGVVLSQGEIGFYGESLIVGMKRGIHYGWSGSPIVDGQGRVIGVARVGSSAKVFGAPATVVQSLRAGDGTAISEWDTKPRTRFGVSTSLLLRVNAVEYSAPDEAVRLLRESVEASPDFWGGWGMLASRYRQRGDLAAALDAERRGAANSPMAVHSLELAAALRAEGKEEEAAAAEARAWKIDPHGVQWRAMTDRAVRLTGEQKFVEAIPLCIAAVNGEPDALEFRVNYAQCLSQTGHADRALPQFDLVLSRDPNMGSAHYGRGVALVYLGREAEAVEEFKRAVALEPRQVVMRRALGRHLAVLGRFVEAEQEATVLRGLDESAAKEVEAAIAAVRAGSGK